MSKKEASFPQTIWSFFSSIQLTVVVLISLAATSILGTLIPQNASPAQYVQKYGDVVYRIFYVLDIYDMYHSWWFQLLLILLTANIIICSIDRLSGLWRTVFVKKPAYRPALFKKPAGQVTLSTRQAAGKAIEKCEQYASKHFSYSQTTEPSDKGDGNTLIYAEKGRWTRFGVYIVHLSVVCLLMGGLIGSLFGFEAFVNIPEGETVNAVRLRSNSKAIPLDFSIRCDDFEVSFYDTGAPKEYRSTLVLLENGKEVQKKNIIVNDPLRYKGINIFQSSYGTMPADTHIKLKDGINLTIQSKSSKMAYPKKAVLGQPVQLPEGGGTLVLKEMAPSYLFMGQRDLGDTLVGEIIPADGGEAKEIKLPVKFSRFDKMRKDSRFVISVQMDPIPKRHYTGLQVTKDPGVPLVFAGFILMIAGCFITFFTSHQRISIEIASKNKGSQIVISGISDKNRLGMEQYIKRMAQTLVPQSDGGKPTREAEEIG